MSTANDRYRDALIRRATGIDRLEGGIAATVLAILNATEVDLVAQIRERLDRIGVGSPTPARIRRLQEQLREIRAVREAAWRDVNAEVRQQMLQFTRDESDFAQRALVQSAGIEGLVLSAPLAADLRGAALSRPFQGRTLGQWLASLRAADVRRLEDAVRLGFVEGEDLDSIVARVRGTRATGFTDGILQTTRRQTEAVVRTGLTHMTTVAREGLWQANSDIIIGLRWTSVLDGRTTFICMSRDGRAAPIGSGTLPAGVQRLEPESARPPAHVNCRSIMVAIISPEGLIGRRPFVIDTTGPRRREVNFRQMARERGIPMPQARREWAQRHVGSLPAETTYEEFLRRQSTAFQDDVLGRTRGILFRRGELSIDRFVSERGRTYTLNELRRRESEAFSEAGL